MNVSLTFPDEAEAPTQPPAMYRVVYDYECPDWGYQSRTLEIGLGQAPAVYGYSPEMAYKPNDYHVDESSWKDAYYELNDFNVDGIRDGQGFDRCRNFLFKGDTALYNNPGSPDMGFPRRELLTMSGNLLQEIGWGYDNQGRRYLKFKTLQPGNVVAGMAINTHPQYVHLFTIVQWRDGQTLTVPKVNRNGYLYYYLVSKDGFGYMPERFVKKV